jgi:uncharacterized protein (DUF302 family)
MKLHLSIVAALVILPTASVVQANERLVTTRSPHAVPTTIDRLSDALKRRNVPILARVDHSSAAERVGEKLEPTQLLIFGNPKLGTPLMQSKQMIGLDLPMKMLAWRDGAGQVWLAYVKPEALRSEYAITDRDDTFAAMKQTLEKLVEETVKAD